MMPRTLLLLYSALVGAMILQLVMISFKRVDRHSEKPQMYGHHVNYSKVVTAANQGSLSATSTQMISANIITTIMSPPLTTSKPLSLSTHSLISKTEAIPTLKQKAEGTQQHAEVKRFRPDDKMLFISEFDDAKETKSVDVLMIILTFHKYFHRRDNIRKTWLDTCKRHDRVSNLYCDVCL